MAPFHVQQIQNFPEMNEPICSGKPPETELVFLAGTLWNSRNSWSWFCLSPCSPDTRQLLKLPEECRTWMTRRAARVTSPPHCEIFKSLHGRKSSAAPGSRLMLDTWRGRKASRRRVVGHRIVLMIKPRTTRLFKISCSLLLLLSRPASLPRVRLGVTVLRMELEEVLAVDNGVDWIL